MDMFFCDFGSLLLMHARYRAAACRTTKSCTSEGRPQASLQGPAGTCHAPPNRASVYRAVHRRHHTVPPYTVPPGIVPPIGGTISGGTILGGTVPGAVMPGTVPAGTVSAGAIAPACRHAADRQPLHAAAGIPAAAGSARPAHRPGGTRSPPRQRQSTLAYIMPPGQSAGPFHHPGSGEGRVRRRHQAYPTGQISTAGSFAPAPSSHTPLP